MQRVQRLFPLLLLALLCGLTSLARTATAAEGDVYVKVDETRLRQKASASSTPVATLTKFTPLNIEKEEAGFAYVSTKKGAKGYVEKSTLSKNPFVSVGGTFANLRSGPGTNDPILWKVKKGWPLRIVDKDGDRVHVSDYENSAGWVHESLLSQTNYVVVKLNWINLREGPGVDQNGQPKFPKRFTAEKGVIFQVVAEKDGWIQVKHGDGDEGWCSAKIVWGWLPE
jgi:SH3-like domain-containing protein